MNAPRWNAPGREFRRVQSVADSGLTELWIIRDGAPEKAVIGRLFGVASKRSHAADEWSVASATSSGPHCTRAPVRDRVASGGSCWKAVRSGAALAHLRENGKAALSQA